LRGVNPQVPDWLAAIIAKLHAKDPAVRYSSAAEVAELLGRHLSLLREPELAGSFEQPRKPISVNRMTAAAAALLFMAVTIGLGAARAGGLPALESLVRTVFQIKTVDGTLRVEVDDPDVKLKVDGEEVVLTGTGPQEFRYRPGQHRVVALKGGVAVKDEIVVIKRGGKKIVTISREGEPAAAAGTADQASPASNPVSRVGSDAQAREHQLKEQIDHLQARLSRFESTLDRALKPDGGPYGSSDAAPAGGLYRAVLEPAAAPPAPPGGIGSVSVYAPRAFVYRQPAPGVSLPPGPEITRPLSVLESLRPLPLSDSSAAWPSSHGPVFSAVFSPDGQTLALACDDGTIVLLSSNTWRVRAVFEGHARRVWSVAFSPDGTTLASAGGDWEDTGTGEVKVWDVGSGRLRFRLKEHDRTMFAVAFSPDGKSLASGGRDQAITLWDVATGQAQKTCVGHEEAVRSIAFHPDGRALASAGFDKTVRIWDAQTGEAIGSPIVLEGTGPNCVAIAPDGKTLAANTASPDDGSDSQIRIWDWVSRKELAVLRGSRYNILHLAFSPNGKVLASGGGRYDTDGEVKLWDLSAGKLMADLKGHSRWVECVGFSGRDQTLISVGGILGENGEIKLWQLGSPPPAVPVPPAVPARPVPF
jgi:WD40 repeat protein